ncbi:MAG: PspC domain-containing protein [Clostridiaceae bacterium]|nr:PspC domain-containing protein [Clostridiaceae bacterium]
MAKKLYVSDRDKQISGVCGGIAEYFDVDSTLIRLGWVILAVMGGSGVLAYIIASVVMPKRASLERQYIETNKEDYQDRHHHEEEGNDKNRYLIGFLLIGVGIFFFGRTFFPHFVFLHPIRMIFRTLFSGFWPVVLIALGVITIISGRK